MSTNPLVDLPLLQVLHAARETRPAKPPANKVSPGAQHETAGSTPTDPRYVAACGQVKPAVPIVFHRSVENPRAGRIVRFWSHTADNSYERRPPNHDYAPASTRHAGGCPQFGIHSLWMTA
jgi:hypothetical protein